MKRTKKRAASARPAGGDELLAWAVFVARVRDLRAEWDDRMDVFGWYGQNACNVQQSFSSLVESLLDAIPPAPPAVEGGGR